MLLILLCFLLLGAFCYTEMLTFEQGWITAIAVAIEWGLAGFVLRYLHLEFDTKPKIL